MAEDRDASQQTEEPTQKKLDDAREHGDVVKSTEVASFAVLAGGTLAIAMFGRSAAASAGFRRRRVHALGRSVLTRFDRHARGVLVGHPWGGCTRPAIGAAERSGAEGRDAAFRDAAIRAARFLTRQAWDAAASAFPFEPGKPWPPVFCTGAAGPALPDDVKLHAPA